MQKIKNFFRINLSNESSINISVFDSYLAIGYLFYNLIVVILFGYLYYKTDVIVRFLFNFNSIKLAESIVYFLFTVIELVPIFIIVKNKKRKLISLGITSKNIVSSFIYGVIFALLYNSIFIINAFANGYELISFGEIVYSFVFMFIFIAFAEEVIFRGYILSRLKGLIKNKWIRIIMCNVIFALMHIPSIIFKYNLSFAQVIVLEPITIVDIFISGMIFTFLYSKTNNLLAPIVMHTLTNVINTLFII